MSAETKPAIRPCKCSATPKFLTCHDGPGVLIQLTCTCDRKGAALIYTRPEDRDRMVQAGIDGWNLAT
jgi:hypothetical protein